MTARWAKSFLDVEGKKPRLQALAAILVCNRCADFRHQARQCQENLERISTSTRTRMGELYASESPTSAAEATKVGDDGKEKMVRWLKRLNYACSGMSPRAILPLDMLVRCFCRWTEDSSENLWGEAHNAVNPDNTYNNVRETLSLYGLSLVNHAKADGISTEANAIV